MYHQLHLWVMYTCPLGFSFLMTTFHSISIHNSVCICICICLQLSQGGLGLHCPAHRWVVCTSHLSVVFVFYLSFSLVFVFVFFHSYLYLSFSLVFVFVFSCHKVDWGHTFLRFSESFPKNSCFPPGSPVSNISSLQTKDTNTNTNANINQHKHK